MNDGTIGLRKFRRLHLAHDGRAGELWPLVLKNALLNILTLTIYRFWAKTNVRRFLWRNTTLNNEPFEYTGTGKELFLGFLIVFFVVLLPLAIFQQVLGTFLMQLYPAAGSAALVGLYFAILFLIGVAIYRARRYRLTRTNWRGIRGGMAGSAMGYAWRYVMYFLLNVVTVGLAYPFGRMRTFGRLMAETTFGDLQFEFKGSSGPLYVRYLVLWAPVLIAVTAFGYFAYTTYPAGGDEAALAQAAQSAGATMPLLMLFLVCYAVPALLWYRVGEMRHFADCTCVAELSFEFDATSWSIVRLVVGNFFITLLTLGFGAPFTQMRTFRYFCDRVSINGTLDIEAIVQSSAEAPSFGEGLADAFELGAV